MLKAFRALVRRLRPSKSLSPLHQELRNLKVKYALEAERLDEIQRQFWANGGVCCPGCGVPGYSKAEDAQARRETRIQQLEAKLKSNPGGTK